MKLREGNVFTRMCLSTRGGTYMTTTHNELDLTVQPPTSAAMAPSWHGPSLYSDQPPHMGLHCTVTPCLWHLVAITGDLPIQTCSFKDPPAHHQCWHLVAIEVCTVGTGDWYASYWNVFIYLRSRDMVLFAPRLINMWYRNVDNEVFW